jgi:hypothetical protein
MAYSNSNNCIRKVGVVVFLDALGTKGLDSNGSCEFIKKRDDFLKEIRNIRKRRAKEFKRDLNIDFPEPEIAVFQDSIIISFEEKKYRQKSEEYHFSFFFAAGQLLIDAITEAMCRDLFFRGAISQDEYVVSVSKKNITILGPAVDDASNYYEIADWIGVIQTPNCQRKYLAYLNQIAEQDSIREGRNISVNLVIDKYRFLFVKYSFPISVTKLNLFSKSPIVLKKDLFISSWPLMACKREPHISISGILKQKIITLPPEYQSKYHNSLRFLDWYKSEFWEGLKERPRE